MLKIYKFIDVDFTQHLPPKNIISKFTVYIFTEFIIIIKIIMK